MVQWLGLYTLNAGAPGSVPGQGTWSHVLQLSVYMSQLNIHDEDRRSRATGRTRYGQINK